MNAPTPAMIESGLSGWASLLLVVTLACCVAYFVTAATGVLIREPEHLPNAWDAMEPGEIVWHGQVGYAPYPDGTYWIAEFGRDHGMLWERDDATEAEVMAILRERGAIE